MIKLLNLFRNNKQKLERLQSLQDSLLQLQAEKDLLADNYKLIMKAVNSEDFSCKEEVGNNPLVGGGYIKSMAEIKLHERKLDKEITFLKSLESVSKALNLENKAKAVGVIKSLYKQGKLPLEVYNETISSKTKKGQTRYADVMVLNTRGELLLLKRSIWEDAHKGAWVIPGGHVDEGEDDTTAAARELYEESGISVDNLKRGDELGIISWNKVGMYEDDKAHISYYLLSGVDTKDFEIVLDEAESRDYLWVKREEINNYPMVFNMADNVKRLLGWDETPNVTIIKKAILDGTIPLDKVADIVKAMNHKYIRKEPDGKGGWNYVYEEDKGKKSKQEDFSDEFISFRLKTHIPILIDNADLTEDEAKKRVLSIIEKKNLAKNYNYIKNLKGKEVNISGQNYTIKEINPEKIIIHKKNSKIENFLNTGDYLEKPDKLNIQKSDTTSPFTQPYPDIVKAMNHKYIHKEPDGKGELTYIYEEAKESKEDIHKSYLQGDITDEEYEQDIEKARKDLSKLRKIKKLVLRDGKLFLQTFHVKTGEREEEELEDVHSDRTKSLLGKEIEVEAGKRYKITTKRKLSVGTLTDIYLDPSTGVRWFTLVDEDGKTVMAAFTSTLSIESLEDKIKEDSISSFEISDFERIRSLGGSSDVGLFKDPEGELYAIKRARDRETGKSQLKDEYIADKIYETLGFATPTSKLYEDGEYKVSEYIKGETLGSIYNHERKQSIYAELRKGFVLDCLLANWDVIGGSEDNIMITSKDKVVRIDNGSALRHRARGARKGPLFGGDVGELKTFLSESTNPKTYEVYNGITPEDISKQISDILKHRVQIMDLIGDIGDLELTKIMDLRLDYLKTHQSDFSTKAELKTKKKLREGMLSFTTQDYFDNGWDDLELEGNSGIKNSIKKQILKVEKELNAEYRRVASSEGLSVEEYKAELQSIVDKLVSKSDFFRATHCNSMAVGEGHSVNALDLVLNKDGRFKSQFETKKSDGSLSPSYRAVTEYEFFGFKDDIKLDAENRPIYGYFSDHKNDIINSDGTIPPPNRVNQYGEAIVKIKREVALRKATVSFKDSLGQTLNLACTPAAKPHFTSLGQPRELSEYKKLLSNKPGVTMHPKGSYVETQYHGQLTVDDIDSIHLSSEAYKLEYKDKGFEKLTDTVNSVTNFIANSGRKDIKLVIF